MNIFKRFGFLLTASILVFWACQLTQEAKIEDTVSFTKLYDTLSSFDKTVIVFKTPDGAPLDTVYQGKVDTLSEIQNLPVRNWDGNKALILIEGFKNGMTVYKVEKAYNGATDKTDSTIFIIIPGVSLALSETALTILEGDSVLKPTVSVTPSTIKDKSVTWTSSQPDVVLPGVTHLKALKAGSARVTVALVSDPSRTATLNLTVTGKTVALEGVSVSPKTGAVSVGGAALRLIAKALPTGAISEFTWRCGDSTRLFVSGDGQVKGLKKGIVTVWAESKANPLLSDSAVITVKDSVPVEAIRFAKNPTNLFMGGAAESLLVVITPAEANPAVDFSVADLAIISLMDNKITPKSEGQTLVIAKSRDNPAKTDTLRVTVIKSSAITSVAIEPASPLPIFTGGAPLILTAKVLPSDAPKLFLWRSTNPSVAIVDTGAVYAISPGKASIIVVSQADSLKKDTVEVTVKRDAPRITLGPDTSLTAGQSLTFLPVVAPQEYGTVVSFKYDLNGDLAWDDSSATIKAVSFTYETPKEYVVRFYVRDTEGNETIASLKVKVTGKPAAADTVPPAVPKLSGASPTGNPPKWNWSSGGGGSGDFRFKLGTDGNLGTGATATRDTSYVLATAVSGTTYTLQIQEKDSSGNWSQIATLGIKYDLSKPTVAFTAPQASGTHYASATPIRLAGTASGPLPITKVAYQVGTGAATAATFATGAWSVAALALQEGSLMAVTVTAEDQAGNKGEAVLNLLLDTTPPTAPTLSTVPAAVIAAAKATFGWTAGSDGASGSGLSGRYRYRLNTGAWKDTAAVLLADLPLSNGSNTFEVQEQDRALLWSTSATRVVRVDSSGPVLALTGQNPRTSTSATVTLAGSVQDSTGPITLTVTGQVAGSGTVTLTGSAWTTASLTLASGANTLVVSAVDQFGNQRTLSVVVNVSVPPPVVKITIPGDNLTITKQTSIEVSYTIDNGTVQKQTFPLETDGVHDLVVSSPANVSGAIGRDTVRVTRDLTPPLAPTLSAAKTPTNVDAIWTWVSKGDNTGGSGVRTPTPRFRYSLTGTDPWTETPTARVSLPLATGTHTLVVQENDRADNWSPASNAVTIVVDKTPPAVTITWPTRVNYVTNKDNISIRYKVDNGPETPMPCPLKDGSNNCPVEVKDNAGNSGSATIVVYRKLNHVFVTPGGAGIRDGSDWENALGGGSLPAALQNSASGKTYWLGTGDYPAMTANSNVTLYGGFVAGNFPYNTNNRSMSTTRIENFILGARVTATLDAFSLVGNFSSGEENTSLILRDITMLPQSAGVYAFFFPFQGTTITANNLVIVGSNFSETIFQVDGTMTLTGGSIRNNRTGNTPVYLNGTTTFNSPLVISGNETNNSTNGPYQVRVFQGSLTVGSGVALSCTEADGQVVLETGATCTKR
ncbi:MAG: Ig-like domain-containing protein [Fibrobacteria bacterium]